MGLLIDKTIGEPTKGLRTLRHASLRDRVFDAIKNAAVRGELKPGQVVTEIGIARSLGVAQATVREALIQLEVRGFVQRRKRRTYVATLSKADIDAIYAVRIPLENLAVEWLIQRKEKDLQGLEEAYERMKKAARGVDVAEFKDSDFVFHSELWSAAGNIYLQEVLERLVPRLFAFAILTMGQYHPTRKKLEEMTEFHGKILRSIKARDGKAAKEALEASMDFTWLEDLPSS